MRRAVATFKLKSEKTAIQVNDALILNDKERVIIELFFNPHVIREK